MPRRTRRPVRRASFHVAPGGRYTMQRDDNYAGYPGATVSGLWQDVLELPAALTATLEQRGGFHEAVDLVRRAHAHRLVISGNGAAYYVATALWLASLAGERPGPEVCAVPSGLVARGRFVWRPGDVFVAVSSSGEFRDLVEAIEGGAPRPYIALTSSPGSTIARGASVTATFQVLSQRALTHSQVFCGAIAAALSIWATLTDDLVFQVQLDSLPSQAKTAIDRTQSWHEEAVEGLDGLPRAAVTCGTGAAWTAALEAALLLKEVARIPAEGAETREAATSGMYALGAADLAFTIPTAGAHPLLSEAESIFQKAGATVVRAPLLAQPVDERLAGILMFPASAALAVTLALRKGFDPDAPGWAATYYETARQQTTCT